VTQGGPWAELGWPSPPPPLKTGGVGDGAWRAFLPRRRIPARLAKTAGMPSRAGLSGADFNNLIVQEKTLMFQEVLQVEAGRTWNHDGASRQWPVGGGFHFPCSKGFRRAGAVGC